MRGILFLTALLIGCNEGTSTAKVSEEVTNRLFIYGDDLSMGIGSYSERIAKETGLTLIDHSVARDGISNAGMLSTFEVTETDIHKGDVFIIFRGCRDLENMRSILFGPTMNQELFNSTIDNDKVFATIHNLLLRHEVDIFLVNLPTIDPSLNCGTPAEVDEFNRYLSGIDFDLSEYNSTIDVRRIDMSGFQSTPDMFSGGNFSLLGEEQIANIFLEEIK